MPTIFHDLYVEAPVDKVFDGISAPSGLDEWWTKECTGLPKAGEEYTLGFGSGYTWQATVTKYRVNQEFELTIHGADADWNATKVGFVLQHKGAGTVLQFSHSHWKEVNEHFRISSFCWATYLMVLKRFLEKGIRVSYEDRDKS